MSTVLLMKLPDLFRVAAKFHHIIVELREIGGRRQSGAGYVAQRMEGGDVVHELQALERRPDGNETEDGARREQRGAYWRQEVLVRHDGEKGRWRRVLSRPRTTRLAMFARMRLRVALPAPQCKGMSAITELPTQPLCRW